MVDLQQLADPGSVGMDAVRLQRIGGVMQSFVDRGEVAGILTLVARQGRVVHRGRFGWRDREAGVPMTDDTIFRIYSMTKPIVSTGLMLLHEEGRFQLEQPVASVLPAFAAVKVAEPDGSLVDPSRPMTIGDLLAHTSGLTYDFLVDTPVAEMYRRERIMHDATRTLEQCVDAIAALPLAYHPGSRWHYSVGIDVAARIIEVLSGQPLGEFLSDRLFGPLGMHDTAFGVAAGAEERVAAMYGLPDLMGDGYHAGHLLEAALAGHNQRLDVSSTYPTDSPEVFQRGGVGLFSTIDDYARFALMLAGGGRFDGRRVIGRKTLELMHANRVPAALLPYEIMGLPSPGLGFGLGSRVVLDPAATDGPGSVGEFGWAGAARTYYWVDPAEELVGVLMTQYMTGVQTLDRWFRATVYQAIDD